MKTTVMTYGITLALTCSLTATLKAQNLYVGNTSLISGLLDGPSGIAISGNDLFVANEGYGVNPGSVGEYTISGATVNASLISDLGEPDGIAISSGPNVFPVPEPSTVALAGLGLGLGAALWLRRRAV